jgi:PhoPQ-activated pathogenicity-related protein
MKACLTIRFIMPLFVAAIMAGCATTDPYAPPKAGKETALDRYVRAPDPSFAWKLEKTLVADDITQHVLNMTSQTWRTPDEVDRTEWQHWVSIAVPEKVDFDTALLFIGGGKNGNAAPDTINEDFARMAKMTNSVIVELSMVPNQPLEFGGDGKKRTEDDLIAYTWDKFLRTGDETWPARLPMTKSAVRAMDAVQAFMASPEGGGRIINEFVVAGGSKRGWTTWTTAAVDDRVVAIVPFVIDLLNVKQSFKHHWEAYGFWAPAVGDYEASGLMDWMGTREYDKLLQQEEPYSYIDRFTMPKFIVNACGDQFFLPDSSQFYWDDLVGDKYLRYVPNAGHGLDDSDALISLIAFYHGIISDTPLPQYGWEFVGDTLVVRTPNKPLAVKYWSATNPKVRDFRVDTAGKIWKDAAVEASPDGSYQVTLQTPAEGWTAQMVELTFEGPGGTPLKFTTPVKVLPETLPFTYTPPSVQPRGYLSK